MYLNNMHLKNLSKSTIPMWNVWKIILFDENKALKYVLSLKLNQINVLLVSGYIIFKHSKLNMTRLLILVKEFYFSYKPFEIFIFIQLLWEKQYILLKNL